MLLLQTFSRAFQPLPDGRYLGFEKVPHLWDGFAEYVYVDLGVLPGTKIHEMPDDMPLRLGALSEQITSTIRGFARTQRMGGFKWGDTVVTQGSGQIGILAIASAREMGAGRVICVGAPESPRLALARKFGADETVDINEYRTPQQRIAREPPCAEQISLVRDADGSEGRAKIGCSASSAPANTSPACTWPSAIAVSMPADRIPAAAAKLGLI